MKQQTPMQKLIDWATENAFNVTAEDGTTYIAIDAEEMRLNYDMWLLEEKEQIINARRDGFRTMTLGEGLTHEEYYYEKYKIK